MGHGAHEVALILKDTMEETGRSFLKVVPVEAEEVAAEDTGKLKEKVSEEGPM